MFKNKLHQNNALLIAQRTNTVRSNQLDSVKLIVLV